MRRLNYKIIGMCTGRWGFDDAGRSITSCYVTTLMMCVQGSRNDIHVPELAGHIFDDLLGDRLIPLLGARWSAYHYSYY
jgi:hypothetical protein